MPNDEMKPNRFGRWALARRACSEIKKHLQSGNVVIVSTYCKSTQYDKPSHADLFKGTKTGLYAKHGKQWLCIDGCAITFWR